MAKLGLLPSDDFTAGMTVDVDTLVRSVLFMAVFLLLWISFHPFGSLADATDVAVAGNLANQVGYSVLCVLLAAWCMLHEPGRLLLLLRPVFIATLLWLALSVLTSWEPSISARRFAFTLVSMGIAGMVLLLPKNIRHFSDVMATVVMIVLVVCYLGVFLAPSVSIHQPTDFLEPELAGDWRGLFGHKNEASATMALFVFIGLFVARVRSIGLGALIVALAGTFLYFTQSKTSIAVLPLVLVISTVMTKIRRPAMGIALALSILVGFNVLSVGSIYFEPIRELLDLTMLDPTFTGRTDIWQFAIDHMLQRPITGYGFSAFWGTEEVVYGMGGDATWANTVGHAHNGYLDLALTVGIPGSILVTLWLVVLPLVDYYRAPRDPVSAPMDMLFLRVCLFAAYESCFESMFFQVGELWLFLIAATFALRFLSVSRVTE